MTIKRGGRGLGHSCRTSGRAGDGASVSASTVLTSTNGTSKHAGITVSGSPVLTFKGNATADGSVRGVRATQTATGKYWFEATYVTSATLYWQIGIDDGTTDFSVAGTAPGFSNSAGICLSTVNDGTPTLYWSAAGNSVGLGAAGTIAQGDKVRIERDKAGGTISVFRIRGGVMTQLGTTQSVAAFTNEYAYGSTYEQTGVFTFNFGQSAASPAATATYNPYG